MRDYSGVATCDLATFLINHGITPEPRSEDEREWWQDRRERFLRLLGPMWAGEMPDRRRKLARIERTEYQFTGLNDADQICHVFGINVSHAFVIVPRPGMVTAALKMAEDEFKDEREQITVDSQTLFARAEELRNIGAAVLGSRTEEQERKLEADRVRARVPSAALAG